MIDTLLTPPGNIESVAPKNFPVLGSALESFGLGPALDAVKGITVFAPQDAALQAALPALMSANTTVATSVLLNHILNGTVAYSTTLTNGMNVTSGSGEPLRIAKNGTGVFVSSGNVTAKVVRADIPLKNGVLHSEFYHSLYQKTRLTRADLVATISFAPCPLVIDHVLLNTASNPQAAQSAASVYASVAATMTQGSGAVGAGATGASASASASASRAAGGAVAGLRFDVSRTLD